MPPSTNPDAVSGNSAKPLSKDELVSVLEDILRGVKKDDTLEGSIEFLLPYPPAGDPEDADFMVRASYRVGNSMGQGSVRLIGGVSA